MASKLQPSAILLLLAALLPAGAFAHDITRILSEAPGFGAFNSLLSQTHIAAEINRRQTITVLAIDDSVASVLSFPDNTLAQVLSVHVILDFYDLKKLKALKRRSTLLTTLFQTTGVAKNNMGFVNFTRLADDRLAFGSGVPGSELGATFVKSVAVLPYNISVLQISTAIVPRGIDTVATAPFRSAPVNGVKTSQDAPGEEKSGNAREAASDKSAAPSADDNGKKSSSAERVASGVSLLAVAGAALLSL